MVASASKPLELIVVLPRFMQHKNPELYRQRLAEFERRASHHAGGSERHAHRGWSYMPIHPFADEHELLARIGVRPEDCWGVDAYWRSEDDVHLFQVLSPRGEPTRNAGLYASKADNDVYFLNLVGIVKQPAITRDLFEEVMAKFANSGILVDFGSLDGSKLKFIGSL